MNYPTDKKRSFRSILVPFCLLLLLAVTVSCSRHIKRDDGFEIVRTFPHDRTAFTQGLVFEDGVLYEGTGLTGKSTLRKVKLDSGDVIQRIGLEPDYFGEGITVFGDNVIQLTWKSRTGFVYDKETFERIAKFGYSTQGWGLTHDGRRLIMSDGTAKLQFLDPLTFKKLGEVEVREKGKPVKGLNELEYIHGAVFANVWRTDRIVRISPDTGEVTGAIDLTGLLDPAERPLPDQVLNGIAYDAAGDRLFVTGKFWPSLFEIRIVPAGTSGK